jgi:hypothetical protein
LGRDLKHLVNTVDELSQRGIGLKVLAGAGAQIDTATANGKLVFRHLCGAGRARDGVDPRAHPGGAGGGARAGG